MQLKTKYKQTEIGLIPADWHTAPLRMLIDPSRKVTYGIVVPGPDVRGGIPMIRAQDYSKNWASLHDVYRVSPSIDKAYKRSRVLTGDVLLTIVGSVGNLAKVPACFNGANITQQTARLSFLRSIANPDFYLNYLASEWGRREITNYTKSGVQPSLNLADVEKFIVAVPPLPEQQAIANALSDMDALINSLGGLIRKKQDIKQATMQLLITGKTRLPEFNGTWESKTVRELSELITKGTTPTSIGKDFTKDGIRFLKIESIKQDGKILEDKVDFIDEITHKLLKRSQLKKDDILFSIAGALGRVAIVTASALPSNTNQALAIVRLKSTEEVNPKFLFYFLKGENTRKYIEATSVQGAQANLSLENVGDMVVKLPPPAEQEAIVAIISAMDEELAALEQRRQKTLLLKEGMKQELLTGRTRLV